MTEKKFRGATSEKLKLDDKKQYTIDLPSGEQIKVSLNDREIYIIENWFNLFAKHNLRFDIWNILQIYGEGNVTQISSMVEQSKSTVARHLKLMEEDGLVISRIADKNIIGKIPPKIYEINKKLLTVLQNSPISKDPPEDPEKLLEYYKKEVKTDRAAIYRYKNLLNLLNHLYDSIENEFDDVEKVKEIYGKYFELTKFAPWFVFFYFSEKYYGDFMELYTEFIKKSLELLTIQNNDPDVKEYTHTSIGAVLPVKALVEIYQQRLKEKKT